MAFYTLVRKLTTSKKYGIAYFKNDNKNSALSLYGLVFLGCSESFQKVGKSIFERLVDNFLFIYFLLRTIG